MDDQKEQPEVEHVYIKRDLIEIGIGKTYFVEFKQHGEQISRQGNSKV
jgi:hypothetical protein